MEPDWWFGRRTSIEQLVEQIRVAARSALPLSMVRMGDGEGAFLSKTSRSDPATDGVLAVWFGDARSSLRQRDVDVIRSLLRNAAIGADILGLPTRFQVHLRSAYADLLHVMSDLPLSSKLSFVDANAHWYLQLSGGLDRILRGQPSVGIVGCRDLGDRVKDFFEISEVRSYLVRGEAVAPGPVLDAHWPGGFSDTLNRLEPARPGEIFLVGAGGLGKAYCTELRRKGAVALDIGSVLDGWAKIDSRVRLGRWPALFAMEHGQSVAAKGLRSALDDACREVNIVGAVY